MILKTSFFRSNFTEDLSFLRFSGSKNEGGAVAILAALLLPVFIGIAAFSIDVTLWYYEKNRLQMIADAAAVGGANGLIQTGQPSGAVSAATLDASLSGFTASANDSLTVNNPPLSGAYAGNAGSVEVILSKLTSRYFAAIFSNDAPTLTVRSVASADGGAKNACLALFGTSGTTLNLSGSTKIDMSECDAYVNSPSSNAVTVSGSSKIEVNSITIVGNYTTNGSSSIKAQKITTSSPTAFSDPYQSLTVPSYSSCTVQNFSPKNKTMTINPGVYCGGFDVGSTSKITLSPGIYIIDGGDFTIGASGTLSGSNVTIILTKKLGTKFPSITISGAAKVSLTASTTGSFANILFYGDRGSSGLSHSFTAGSTQTLSGVLYFPTADLILSGNSKTSGGCFNILSKTLTLNGSSSLETSSCSSSGGSTSFAKPVKLVH